jgi:hypothetical protein
MSIDEQNIIKEKYYTEAIRYMDNAKETLIKAGKKDYFYIDNKYVKTACGIAYNAVLKALDGYFILIQEEKRKGRKSAEYYERILSKRDKKLLNYFEDAYKILHLNGYNDGNRDTIIINRGFEVAYILINKIKPAA